MPRTTAAAATAVERRAKLEERKPTITTIHRPRPKKLNKMVFFPSFIDSIQLDHHDHYYSCCCYYLLYSVLVSSRSMFKSFSFASLLLPFVLYIYMYVHIFSWQSFGWLEFFSFFDSIFDQGV
jgi:hypothetical protein